jgi:hypothetical protein
MKRSTYRSKNVGKFREAVKPCMADALFTGDVGNCTSVWQRAAMTRVTLRITRRTVLLLTPAKSAMMI